MRSPTPLLDSSGRIIGFFHLPDEPLKERKIPMPNEILKLAAQLVTSHAAATALKTGDLIDELKQVYGVLASLDNENGSEAGLEAGGLKKLPIPLKEIVRDNYVVCLECEKKFRSLKGHLKSAHNLTPEEYFHLYGLDQQKYPLVCQEYSAVRRQLALDIGLGAKRYPRQMAQSA